MLFYFEQGDKDPYNYFLEAKFTVFLGFS